MDFPAACAVHVLADGEVDRARGEGSISRGGHTGGTSRVHRLADEQGARADNRACRVTWSLRRLLVSPTPPAGRIKPSPTPEPVVPRNDDEENLSPSPSAR